MKGKIIQHHESFQLLYSKNNHKERNTTGKLFIIYKNNSDNVYVTLITIIDITKKNQGKAKPRKRKFPE